MTSLTGIPDEEPHEVRDNPQVADDPAPRAPRPPDPRPPDPGRRESTGPETGWADPNTAIEPAPEAAHQNGTYLDGLYLVHPAAADPSAAIPVTDRPWAAEPQFGREFYRPAPPERIPNFGHLGILLLLLGVGLLCTGILTRLALHAHIFGVSTVQAAMTDIHYTLGSEAILYLATLAACLLVFPLVWHKNFFAGVQWNGATALRLRWRLVSAAGICFLLALLNSAVMPGPANAPIDKIFRAPGAAWLLFGFGVTFAPFFEETFFRGFLLPALSTAYDWFAERTRHQFRRPLAENGHPRWSMSAMVFGSILTSIPFALLHAEQTGYAVGALLLLMGVSLVLCAVRLSTRSLAASVLVHASYNFMLFFIMLVGTGGFRHLEKM